MIQRPCVISLGLFMTIVGGVCGAAFGQDRWLADVERTADIPYAETENPRQRLDLYLPKKRASDKPLPVVVFIHGGAWRAGDKSGGGRNVVPLVASGKFAGASIGYRLSGEAQWPAQIHDCKAAIRWLKANAKKYNLDSEKIAVWGSSAGGHLVAMLGTSGDVKEFEGELGKHLDQSSRVACVVDYFGPSNFLTMGEGKSNIDHNSARSPEALLIGGAILENKEKAAAVSPITYVTKDDAPFLIAHGDQDFTVPIGQSKELADALAKAEVPVTFITMKGAGHGFGGPEINDRVRAFVGKHLLGEEGEVSGEAIEASAPPFGRRPLRQGN